MKKADRKDQEQRERLVKGAIAAFQREIDAWQPQPRERTLLCPYCAAPIPVPAGGMAPTHCETCGVSWEERE